MIIYFNEENRIVGVDLFYEKERKINPIEINGVKTKYLVINNEELQKKVFKIINNNELSSPKISDYIYDIEKQDIVLKPVGSLIQTKSTNNNCCKTVIVDLQNFTLNADLRRHIKKVNENEFEFKRLGILPYHLLKKSNIYSKDDLIYKEFIGQDVSEDDRIRIYSLFKNGEIASLITLVYKDLFTLLTLYWEVSDASYLLLYKVINELKQENFKFLDLGGLTKEDSGINQFKKKWGITINRADLFLFKDNK